MVCLPSQFRGHGNKKRTVNKLSEALEIQVFSFRCGWMVRNMHSAFDYIFNTIKKDAKCGKVLAGWLANSAGEYLGGYPPTVDMIHHKKTDFIKFAEKLFIGDEHTNNHVKVFLVCSLVFYYEDMVQVIKQCPNKKYDNIKKHAMICFIDGALRDVNCTEHDLKQWRIEIQKDFKEQNFSQLKI